MIRSALVTVLFLVTSLALAAADLPKDIDAKARDEIIKDWQPAYAAERERIKGMIEEAESLIKFAATVKEGKEKLAQAKAELKALQSQQPWLVKNTPFVLIRERSPAGSVGALPDGDYIANAVPEGVLVEAAIKLPGEPTLVKFLAVNGGTLPKKAKKDQPISKPPGLWYVAGTVDVKGKAVPVIYKFDLKKDDFPSEKK